MPTTRATATISAPPEPARRGIVSPAHNLFDTCGGGSKPAQAAFFACYAQTEDEAPRIADETWRAHALPGELLMALPPPRHFEQTTTLVTPEILKDVVVIGTDPDQHLTMIEQCEKATTCT